MIALQIEWNDFLTITIDERFLQAIVRYSFKETNINLVENYLHRIVAFVTTVIYSQHIQNINANDEI